MAGTSHHPIAVYGAIAANAIIAVVKFTAAFFTGSSAMLAEGIHSVVDTGNQALLLFGVIRSRKPPDRTHPYGYGKERYFWGLIVAIVLFGIGGGMSAYEGIQHLLHPSEIRGAGWAYVVLAVSAVVEAAAWYVALREFKPSMREANFWQAFRSHKDPAVFTVLAEDTAALSGLAVAFLGIFLGQQFGLWYADGAASIVIGLILAITAAVLAYESRALLIGESADSEVVHSIRRLAESDPAVEQVRSPLTMHLGPDQVLLNIDVEFRPNLSADEVTRAINRLEQTIRQEHPDVQRIFIEADALRQRGNG